MIPVGRKKSGMQNFPAGVNRPESSFSKQGEDL